MAFGIKDFLDLARTLDRLFAAEKKHGDLIEAQARRLQDISERVARLEAREEILIVEAKAAAGTAASAAATHHLTDMAMRIGALDERTRRLDPSDDPRRLTDGDR